ncbi:MAG TPA: YgjV family protein [Candidatus Saccharimonas sp.]|nr:YgjV family protein [Candidatus Saccharimonas sp.]
MNPFIVQGIGYLALFFVILSFQKNKRVNILLIMLIGLVLFVVHYALLQAWVGSLMNLIEAAMVFVAYKKEDARWAQKGYWLYVFIGLFFLAGALTAKSVVDFLPAIAQTFGAVAVWQTNPRAIRFLMLGPRPLWFIYNFAVGSYAGMTAEVFILASVLVGIIRFDILRKPAKR